METLVYLSDIIRFSFKDVMVGIATVTLLTLITIALISGLVYIIYKLIKGNTKK